MERIVAAAVNGSGACLSGRSKPAHPVMRAAGPKPDQIN